MKYTATVCLMLLPLAPAALAEELRPGYAAASVAPEQSDARSPWSRPYVGVFGGVGSGEIAFTSSADEEYDLRSGGFVGGLRAGYDYEAGNVLFGAMADYAFTSIGAQATASYPGLGSAEVASTLTSLATLRARAGTTYKNMLYYVHGGAAMGTVEMTANGEDIPGTIDNPRFGYTLGVGIEYAIGEHATFQTEYSFVDFGKQDIYSSGGYTLADDLSFHTISSGIALRF